MKKNYTIAVLISSYTCNLNCEFCRLSEINQKFGRHKDLMSVETLDDIIEREMPGAFVVTGGEPFLNMQLLMALKDKKAATKINTNGTIIWPDTEWPSNFRLNISESGHGYTPLYQQMIDTRMTKPVLQFVITKDNYDFIIDKIKNLDVSTITGFHISLDHWLKWSDENEEFTKMIAQKLANIHIEKNLSYNLYFSEEEEHQVIKRFTPTGEQTNTLWSGDIPYPYNEEIEREVYIDREIYNNKGGKKIVTRGVFKVPYSYYQSLLFKEMKRYSVT